MGTTQLQFLHISEFYQTIMFLILLIPVFAYIQVYRHSLWVYLNLNRVEETHDYENWLNQEEDPAFSEIQKQIDSIEATSRRETKVNMEIEHNPDVIPSEPISDTQEQTPPNPDTQNPRNSLALPMDAAEPDSNHQKPQLTPGQTRIMYFYNQIVDVYEKYLPIIMTMIVMGILTDCCEVLSLALFFGYILSTFMLDYAEMFDKLKKEYQSKTLIPFINLVSSFFLVGIFLNLLTRNQYTLL